MKYNTEDNMNRMTAYFLGVLFIFILTFYAVLHVESSDYEKHSAWAAELSIRHLLRFMQNYAAYPLWHIVTKTFYRVFEFPLIGAAATTTSLFNCFAYGCVIWAWDFLGDVRISSYLKSFWACCLLVVGPLYAPWFSDSYYLGQGSGNVWHNPTNIAVKGFCILCFILIIQLLQSQKTFREERKTYLLLSVLLLASAFAKPSFLQGMIPGLGLYFIISIIMCKGKRERVTKYFVLADMFIPAVCLLSYQLVFSFFADTEIHVGGSIGIEFGRILKHWSPNLLISFLLAFAFPLLVLILDFKRLIKKIHIQVMLCYEFCAWGESAWLYENGAREMHGNWLWGSFLSMFIVWMIMLFEYFNMISDDRLGAVRKKICLYGGNVLLFSHLLCGVFYWYNLTHA